ncbi:MAG: hypothetical protein HYT12_04255 [Candidatus Liptonbacteria bacterium]|nr:hypothetical protein [Candidatus Liptonbacteria bacterium]
MGEHDNIINIDVIKLVAMLLTLVGCALILVGLTDLAQCKMFRFVLGEMAMVTAIAYSFQMAREASKFAAFGIAIFFIVASMNFAQATWLVAW